METDEGLAVLNLETGELVNDRAGAFAALLAWGAEDLNHAAGLLDGEEGARYFGGAALWKPSIRLDPNWMETMRRRSRGRAKKAVKAMMQGLSAGERMARERGWHQRLGLKLLTLTMPHHAGTDTLSEVNRLNRALTLLKKRAVWSKVRGGVKGVEDALDADGPHVHAHVLILAQRIERAELVAAWWECLNEATLEAYGFGLSEDCVPVVDIRQVKRNPRKGYQDEVSTDDAIHEVTKYITKPSDYLKADQNGRRIARETLVDICEVKRWPRMFELLGRARGTGKPRLTGRECSLAAQAALDSIHRAYSTGEPLRIPECLGWEIVEGWDSALDGPEKLRLAIVESLKLREKGYPKKPRPPSWRDLLDTMALPDWLQLMRGRVQRGRKFRLKQILDLNPSAYLVDFTGRVIAGSPEFAAV